MFRSWLAFRTSSWLEGSFSFSIFHFSVRGWLRQFFLATGTSSVSPCLSVATGLLLLRMELLYEFTVRRSG